MDLADLIEPGQVIFGAHATTKEKLLLDLASRAAATLNLDPKMVFNALQAREQLGSTGLGEGFALPHARIEGLDRFFGRLNQPIHFDSVDAKPVDLVFLLLIPAAAQGDHLAALAAISRHLRDKKFVAMQPTLSHHHWHGGLDPPIVPRSGRRCSVIRTIGGSSMTRFVGLDVSQKITAICVVGDAGRRLWRGQCPTNPEQTAFW
jgi:nitrogen PTS system EIIA component